MKHKVSELEGALLDVAVAIAQGVSRPPRPVSKAAVEDDVIWLEAGPGKVAQYSPSTDWRLGGQIIESKRIAIEWRDREERWNNELVSGARWLATVPGGTPTETGPTALIAAMRAYVASKYGEEIELP